MQIRTKAYLAIITQSLIIGLSFLFVKIALNSADTMTLLAHRFTVATVGILIFHLVRPGTIQLKMSDVWKILPFCLLYPVFFFLFQTLGLNLITSSAAGIVSALSPVVTVTLAGLILKEKTSPTQKVCLLLSVLGMIFINVMGGFGDGRQSLLGFLFCLMSVLSFAFYNVLIKRIVKNYSTTTIVFVMTIAACIIFNGVALIQHGIEGTLNQYFAPFGDLNFIGAILYLAIPSSLMTSWLATYALTYLPSSTVGLFNNVPPVVTILVGIIFLTEPFHWYHVVGIIMILIGTVGFNLLNYAKGSHADSDN
ncbi:MAG: DMT family transporter [Fastidiosipilaceae bacterium]|jgi:drug/metabolite transporter (DMT)-like permease|nr:DMT family transporter [Clostridiaceae bacterium]